MVKLVRVERTTEQTGHENCPLAPCQRPEYTPQHTATTLTIVSSIYQPNTPVHTLDSRWTPKLTKLFVKPFRPGSR